MTPFGRSQRNGKSSWACGHDRDRFRLARRTIDQFGFVRRLRIDDTCRDLRLEDEIKACLVACDAGRDLGRPCVTRLSHEVRIRKKGPGHRNQVRGTFRQDRLRRLGRVDPVRRNCRYPDLSHGLLRDPRKCAAGHARGNRRDPGFMPPDSGIQEPGPSILYGLGQFGDFGPVRAVWHEVDHAQAADQHEVGPCRLPHPTQDFDRQSHPVFEGTAPAVRPLAGEGHEELVQRIAFGSHQLDSVMPGLPGPSRRFDDVRYPLLDPLFIEFDRGTRRDRRS